MTTNTETILDQWLVRAAQSGDRRALERLMARWRARLVGYATSQLGNPDQAQDAVQEALLHLANKLHSLDDAVAFPKWVYQIVHRRCVDRIRDNQAHRKRENRLDMTEERPESESIEESLTVSSALGQLDTQSYQVVRLFYLDEFDVKQIAEILNIPAGTVKSRLFKARQNLANILGDKQ